MSEASPRPRVVLLDHCAQLSGAELALCRILPHVRGADVRVILGEDGPLREELESLGVAVEVVALPPDLGSTRRAELARRLPVRKLWSTLNYIRALRRRLRTLQPDIVHTSSNKAHIYGGISARSLGIPQLWHARDRLDPEYLPGLGYMLTKIAANTLPSYFIANSESTLLTIPARRRSRAWVLPEAVPQDRGGSAEERLALPRHRNLTFGFLGRVAPWKGQNIFLEAFASAFGNHPEVQGLIVGGPLFGEHEYMRSLHDLAAALGIQERMEFTGWVRDTNPMLDRMDVLVHASTIPEPFGQVIIEGMAAGLPVIASAAGGPAEIITNGHDGLLSSPGDVQELASHMTRLARDAALRGLLARNALKTASRYRPETVAERMTAIYVAVTR